MPQEIELKLAIDTRDIPTLRESSILRELSLKHTPRRSLLSVYYDTPSFTLARGGIMLRVRSVGRDRVQCVKMNAAATSLFQRTELESPIRGNQPDLMQIADPGIRQLIQKRCAGHDLARAFATKVRRETWLLQIGRSEIEFAIDRGVIVSKRKKAPISEVELELKSGQPVRLYQLAHRLNAIVPLRIETKSKEARGYELVKHAKLAAPKAGPILVNSAMSVRECFVAIAQPCVAHVLASANFADKSNDPEGIHQLRVAIRRMRVAFSIFHRAMPESYRFRLAVDLRRLEQKLSAARDWDVLAEETIASMPGGLRSHRSTQHLARIARTKRAEGDKSAHKRLRDPRYTNILLQLASWVDGQFGCEASPAQAERWQSDILAGPAPPFAAKVLRRFHHKACKLGRKVRKLDPADIHRLRIRIKKLRCATDFFGGFWRNKRTKRYLVSLKALEQALGVFHDTIVADGLIARFAAVGGADAISADPVNCWLTKHQQVLRKELIKRWHKFANQQPFWDGA